MEHGETTVLQEPNVSATRHPDFLPRATCSPSLSSYASLLLLLCGLGHTDASSVTAERIMGLLVRHVLIEFSRTISLIMNEYRPDGSCRLAECAEGLLHGFLVPHLIYTFVMKSAAWYRPLTSWDHSPPVSPTSFLP